MAASKKLLCDVCHGLSLQRSDFEASVFEPVRKLKQVILRDTLGALRARAIQCAFCQLILHVLEKNENLPESFLQDTQWEDPFRDPGLASLRALQESTWDISDAREWKLYWYWCQNGSGWTQKMVNSQSALFSNFENSKNRYHCIQLVDDAGTAGYRRARRVSDHINIGMLQGWLDRCIREHGPSCKETGLAVSNHPNTGAVPFLVIDVAENRLAKLPLEAKYATLSYVWGPENWPRTAQSNIQEFMQHGALARLQLPATISDAIQVAHRLGCRYLWVDSLCIVQDDPMKNQTIASMDSVYEHAEVTIVAASGHCAQDGLPGWTDLSVRVQRLRPVDIQPDFSVGVVQRYGIATEGCPHRSRAWTFQEGVLSKRCLVFLDGLVFFSCQSALWREDINLEFEDIIPEDDGIHRLSFNSIQDPLSRFQQQLSSYTRRNLTFQSDALNAFAGLQRAMTRSLSGTRFFHGLPAAVFDWAILWSSVGSMDEGGGTLTRCSEFPSWSWAGWKGHVSPPDSPEQAWLLQKTWINWCIVNEDSDCVLLWQPLRDGGLFGFNQVTVDASFLWEITDEDEDEHVDGGILEGTGERTETLKPCPQYRSPAKGNPYGRSQLEPGLNLSQSQYLEHIPQLGVKGLPVGTLVFRTVSAVFYPHEVLQTTSNSRPRVIALLDKDQRIRGWVQDDEDPSGHASDNGILGSATSVEVLLLSFIDDSHTGAVDPRHVGTFRYLRDAIYGKRIYAEKEDDSTDGGDDENEDEDDHHRLNKPGIHEYDSDDDVHISEFPDPRNWMNVMLVRPVGTHRTTTPSTQEEQEVIIHERVGLGLLHSDAQRNSIDPGAAWKTIYLC